ncbi:MAG TPA: hypothetical protein VNA25_26855 [Phycisphaerae bacterium]|nr:hypothetical protein [Phycisphaerae bacterium]
MPLALDPNATFEIWLDSDAAVPAATRPVFVCRHMADGALKALAGMQDAINAADGMERIDLMHEELRKGLVGWRHMIDPQTKQAIAYEPAKTMEVLNAMEVVELIEKMAQHAQTTAADRKKSVPRSPRRSPRRSSTH